MTPKIKIKETALLVIDVINSCCHKNCEIEKWGISFNKIRRMLPKLKNFIANYKSAGGKVIFVNCVPWKKKFLPSNINELYKDPSCEYYSSDESGFEEKLFRISQDKNDFVITKNSYDAFTSLELNNLLRKLKVKYCVIAGVFGDGCVNSTIQGGFSSGYGFIILKDLIETTDVKTRQKLQKLLKDYTWPVMFGKTINSECFFDSVK